MEELFEGVVRLVCSNKHSAHCKKCVRLLEQVHVERVAESTPEVVRDGSGNPSSVKLVCLFKFTEVLDREEHMEGE